MNTVPLVWGMLHGRQQRLFDICFETPAQCADSIAKGEADIGIVPVVEVQRQGLDIVPGVGIACHSAVRSILLISKVDPERIRTLVTDSNSRTSVILSRIILAEKFGVEPELISMAPNLTAMLEVADAALIIGDAALRIDLKALPYRVWDLGEEWTKMTGLPMVFAVWAGHNVRNVYALSHSLTDSLRHGLKHLEEIVEQQARVCELPEAFVRDYFRHNIAYEIGAREIEGMEAFLKLAAPFDNLKTAGTKP